MGNREVDVDFIQRVVNLLVSRASSYMQSYPPSTSSPPRHGERKFFVLMLLMSTTLVQHTTSPSLRKKTSNDEVSAHSASLPSIPPLRAPRSRVYSPSASAAAIHSCMGVPAFSRGHALFALAGRRAFLRREATG